MMKGIRVLQEMCLIAMEHSRYIDRRGMKWKGNNLYTIRPVSETMEIYHARQLEKLKQTTARQEAQVRAEKLGVAFTPLDEGQSA